jgi:hypothetical protein
VSVKIYHPTLESKAQVEVVGYQANVVGFGWTNAAFVELLHALQWLPWTASTP